MTTATVSAARVTPGGEAKAVRRSGRGNRSRGFDRPRFLYVVCAVALLLLFVPVLVVLLYSLGWAPSLVVFHGFGTHWYGNTLGQPRHPRIPVGQRGDRAGHDGDLDGGGHDAGLRAAAREPAAHCSE